MEQKLEELKHRDVFDDFEKERAIKKLEKEIYAIENAFKMKLKKRFMHIHGMIPRFTKYETTGERLESWQATLTID